MNQKPKGEPFTGRTAEMRTDTPWLAVEDLIGLGDVEVTIEEVRRYHNVEFEAGRKKATAYALKFVGKAKELVLNTTNRKQLLARFREDVTKWKGQKIKLYVDPSVKMKGETVGGIRIR